MKEQWKKLDSDAKLLVNIEEGKPLPIKIELPISAFISNKSDCCTKLLTILRVSVLAVFLLLLCWAVIFMFAYIGFDESNVEINKVNVNDDSIDINDDKSNLKNIIYQSFKENEEDEDEKDQSILNDDILDVNDKLSHHPLPTENVFTKKDTFLVEVPAFISKSNIDAFSQTSSETYDRSIEYRKKLLNELSEKLQKDAQKFKKEIRKILSEKQSEELVDLTNDKISPKDIENFIDELVKNITPLTENVEESKENEKNLKIIETYDKLVEESRKKENNNEVVNLFFNILNTFFNEQLSVEDVSFTKSKLNSEEKEKIENLENSSNEDKLITTTESIDGTEKSEDKNAINKKNILTDSPTEILMAESSFEMPALMAKYLEPFIDNYDEMLIWYITNRYNPNFETSDFDYLKVRIAKLLYSSNIAEFDADLEFVVNSLLLQNDFVEDLKMLVNRQMHITDPEYGSNQYYIAYRINLKLILSRVYKKNPDGIDKFSKLIENQNRYEFSKLNDSQKIIENEFAVSKNIENIVNAMKKVAVDDITKDNGYVEFVEPKTTPDTVAIEQENESNTEKSDEIVEESEEEGISQSQNDYRENPVTTRFDTYGELEKSKESEEKQMESSIENNEDKQVDLNKFSQLYGDFYDY